MEKEITTICEGPVSEKSVLAGKTISELEKLFDAKVLYYGSEPSHMKGHISWTGKEWIRVGQDKPKKDMVIQARYYIKTEALQRNNEKLAKLAHNITYN